MKLQAELIFKDENAEILMKLLKTDKELKSDRSIISFTRKKDNIYVNIDAKDSVALRATINGVMKIIGTYEKTKRVVKDDKRR